jgi:transcriptional regulator with GAF, ATPase, and Fis domain
LLAEGSQPEVTAYAGVPLIVEAAMTVLAKADFKRLAARLGYSSWRTARRHFLSLLVLVASGGECLEDLETLPTLAEAAGQLMAEAMRRTDDNQSIAARLLGISQPALSKRLKRLYGTNEE